MFAQFAEVGCERGRNHVQCRCVGALIGLGVEALCFVSGSTSGYIRITGSMPYARYIRSDPASEASSVVSKNAPDISLQQFRLPSRLNLKTLLTWPSGKGGRRSGAQIEIVDLWFDLAFRTSRPGRHKIDRNFPGILLLLADLFRSYAEHRNIEIRCAELHQKTYRSQECHSAHQRFRPLSVSNRCMGAIAWNSPQALLYSRQFDQELLLIQRIPFQAG